VTNYSATDEIRASFDRCIEIVRATDVELVDTRAPFDAARFDAAAIQRDRADTSRDHFANIDAIVLPTLAARAPTIVVARAHGEMAVSPNNTFFCNYFGFPAISVPAGFLDDGLPFGVQFVGPPGSDDRVLALAREFQRAAGSVSAR
jgi:Asp-tRNA(Asn)/Glu-tRNA(Gln) amidotransferase A subunit family amidase